MTSWIAVDQPEFRSRVRQLGLPAVCLDGYWSSQVADQAGLTAVLEWRDGLVQLRPLDKSLGNPVVVDFIHGKTGFRFLRAQHEMIVKAVAGRSKEPLTVIDATAGLGRDSFILAAAGFSVRAIERHPAIACLLWDGMDRASMSPEGASVTERISLQWARAHTVLADLPEPEQPDVIYLDPMFPERSKQALVKKEMRLFRDLVGEDLDGEALLEIALQTARKRVVVKRPRKAESVAGRKPGYQLLGKSSRFDVYPV
ncbi:MAG: class I SAM-dependent methyltransferase [Pseudomonadota bacterium]|nr:class I SAM-dependent methyltransferase [Pseudomonadota bacterium]